MSAKKTPTNSWRIDLSTCRRLEKRENSLLKAISQWHHQQTDNTYPTNLSPTSCARHLPLLSDVDMDSNSRRLEDPQHSVTGSCSPPPQDSQAKALRESKGNPPMATTLPPTVHIRNPWPLDDPRTNWRAQENLKEPPILRPPISSQDSLAEFQSATLIDSLLPQKTDARKKKYCPKHKTTRSQLDALEVTTGTENYVWHIRQNDTICNLMRWRHKVW